MSSVDILLLAIGLAMDCLTVSIASGVVVGRMEWRTVGRMAFLFGLFQAAMPLIGWLAVVCFASRLESVGHWAAFGLLAFVGVRMIWESIQENEEKKLNPRQLRTQLVLAVATSIDALSVGMSMGLTGYDRVAQLILPVSIIGAVSFVFSVMGWLVGVRSGRMISKRIRPEVFGGLLLIAIAVKILLSSL